MATKSNIVSKILFILSSVLFLIFVITIFFRGQEVGGAIYFIYFATFLAFTFLDRKYHSNFINLYRYSVYVSDLFNILASASILYYGLHVPFMIAVLSIWCVCLIVDLVSKNRLEKRRVASILVGVFNVVTMLTIFQYFFITNLSVAYAIGAVVTSSLVLILKIVLALVPLPKEWESRREKQEKPALVDEHVLESEMPELDVE